MRTLLQFVVITFLWRLVLIARYYGKSNSGKPAVRRKKLRASGAAKQLKPANLLEAKTAPQPPELKRSGKGAGNWTVEGA